MWDEFHLLAWLSCCFLTGVWVTRWHPLGIFSYHLTGVAEKQLQPLGQSALICGINPKDIQGFGTYKRTLVVVPFARFTSDTVEWEQGFPFQQRVKTMACGWLPRASELGVSNLLFQSPFLPPWEGTRFCPQASVTRWLSCTFQLHWQKGIISGRHSEIAAVHFDFWGFLFRFWKVTIFCVLYFVPSYQEIVR